MAIDNKYGRVTLENGTVGEDEPVFVFRAQDAMLLKVLAYYHFICMKEGSPRRHLDKILDGRDQIAEWQKDSENFTKIPESKE